MFVHVLVTSKILRPLCPNKVKGTFCRYKQMEGRRKSLCTQTWRYRYDVEDTVTTSCLGHNSFMWNSDATAVVHYFCILNFCYTFPLCYGAGKFSISPRKATGFIKMYALAMVLCDYDTLQCMYTELRTFAFYNSNVVCISAEVSACFVITSSITSFRIYFWILNCR